VNGLYGFDPDGRFKVFWVDLNGIALQQPAHDRGTEAVPVFNYRGKGLGIQAHAKQRLCGSVTRSSRRFIKESRS
jgi:hypothetical protein